MKIYSNVLEAIAKSETKFNYLLNIVSKILNISLNFIEDIGN